MLEEMCDAVDRGGFVTRPGRRIEADGNRLDALHRTARHPQAVGKGRQLHHCLFASGFMRLRNAKPYMTRATTAKLNHVAAYPLWIAGVMALAELTSGTLLG